MAIVNASGNDIHELIKEGFVIVDFYSATCAPCKMFARVLEDIETEIPFLDIVKLNATENPDIAAELGIAAYPTVHFYKDGKLVKTHVGVMPAGAVKAVIAECMYS